MLSVLTKKKEVIGSNLKDVLYVEYVIFFTKQSMKIESELQMKEVVGVYIAMTPPSAFSKWASHACYDWGTAARLMKVS